jgi:hypothetical protein
LEPNEAKTVVVSFDDGVPFLGQDIGPTTDATADHLVHPVATSVFVVTQDSLVRVRDDRLLCCASRSERSSTHRRRGPLLRTRRRSARRIYILGARVLEERRDYSIV